jgi:hypothetical protein
LVSIDLSRIKLIGKVEAVAMATAIYYSIEQLRRFVMLKNAGVANGVHYLVARIMNSVRRAMAYAVHSGVCSSRTAYNTCSIIEGY